MTRVVNIAQSGGNNVTMRNKIINGAMMIDQRYAGGTIGPITGSAYTLDRWNLVRVGGTSTLTPQQSTIAPAGFVNSLIVTVGSGATPSGTEERSIFQRIEGLNCSDLSWGTANAQPVTLSFWVRSSVTGTYGVVLGNSAFTRSYVASYTINAANTWEQKTVTVAGDTSGTWLTSNGVGIAIYWDLGVGTTYSGPATGAWQGAGYEGLTGGTKLSATTGATFYITGVQLEAGTTATPFEQRLYGTELALCQRYFTSFGGDSAYQSFAAGIAGSGTSTFYTLYNLPVSMRSSPSVAISGAFRLDDGYSASFGVTGVNTSQMGTSVGAISVSVASGLTTGRFYQLQANNSTASRLQFSSEL